MKVRFVKTIEVDDDFRRALAYYNDYKDSGRKATRDEIVLHYYNALFSIDEDVRYAYQLYLERKKEGENG